MKAVSAITQGVQVTVISTYHEEHSKPSLNKYVHSYNVTITNLSGLEIQLISRHWIIKDANGKIREVKGDGVIGLQPILMPEESHQYTSWCPLSTPVGKMGGTYAMIRRADNSVFNVTIPEFKLIADFKMN
ncbi:MAG: Co2+/Mg2+ efflux protein ApaG [Saprospiraceae bacterium]|nr:Co2+/Mg2+ efflux protein ApaG [Saprospiraceae bacterium]